ncbi:MAG: hypothetical protein ABSB30_03880 [Terracidiphilus sp.]
MNLRIVHKISICGFLAVALLTTRQLSAQYLTLEGQTGGFLTPTAYVIESAKGHIFSHPAISYHFVGSDAVIGDIQTFSITEGFGNRAEVGYTRSLHWTGDSPLFSSLWNYNGMNVFHGKAVLIRDGQFGPAMPGLAIGGVVRLNDHYVSGALNYELALGADKGFTNGDVYVVATKTWAKPPVPFLLNFGLKMTNGEIFGIGGQATRFGGRLFGGLGIPLPVGHGIVAVPSAGFTQEPKQVKNLGAILVGGKAHIPMTMDYAVRVTQREHPRFSIDAGVGQIAGNIGTTYIASPPLGFVPVNLQARHVIGAGASYRF